MQEQNLAALTDELKPMNLFEWLWVGKIGNALCATYVVNSREGDDVDLNRELIFYRTVDVRTGHEVELYAHPKLSAGVVQAFYEHYSVQYVRDDGLEQMWQFGVDAHMHVTEPGKAPMDSHPKFGMSFHYADVGELHLNDGSAVFLY